MDNESSFAALYVAAQAEQQHKKLERMGVRRPSDQPFESASLLVAGEEEDDEQPSGAAVRAKKRLSRIESCETDEAHEPAAKPVAVRRLTQSQSCAFLVCGTLFVAAGSGTLQLLLSPQVVPTSPRSPRDPLPPPLAPPLWSPPAASLRPLTTSLVVVASSIPCDSPPPKMSRDEATSKLAAAGLGLGATTALRPEFFDVVALSTAATPPASATSARTNGSALVPPPSAAREQTRAAHGTTSWPIVVPSFVTRVGKLCDRLRGGPVRVRPVFNCFLGLPNASEPDVPPAQRTCCSRRTAPHARARMCMCGC
jgi:hypothetical protein